VRGRSIEGYNSKEVYSQSLSPGGGKIRSQIRHSPKHWGDLKKNKQRQNPVGERELHFNLKREIVLGGPGTLGSHLVTLNIKARGGRRRKKGGQITKILSGEGEKDFKEKTQYLWLNCII